MSRALQTLRDELTATHHQGRLERMLELGRQAQRDPQALALVDALAEGDVFERRLSLLAQHTLRDGKRLLRFTEDPAASIRALAFTMAPRICDDGQALEALKVAYTLRRERPLLRNLAVRHRRAVVDRYLDWLAERPGLHDFADIVPWASPDGVRRHLGRALARPSAIFWDRLARSAPAALGPILSERLRDVPGEPDAVTRQLIERHAEAIVAGAPDAGLELLDLLFARKIFSKLQLVTRLGGPRPAATLALIERHDLRPHPGVFRRSAASLTPDELARVVRRSPHLLGPAEPLRAALSREQLQAVLSAWCDVLKDHATWGFDLLDRLTDPELRERAYQRWSVAARSHEGIIAIDIVTKLPNDLREREGRRHLFEVVALDTRPADRIPYARFLPWDEATAFIKDFLGFPDGYVRAWALEALLAIPGLRPDEPAVADKALALVIARKNEQDPVRGSMLRALLTWPRECWRKEHVPTIHRILRDALDAGDLSHATAVAAESLLVRTFRLDPAAGAEWLGTFIKERGNLYEARLGAHLSDDDVRAAAPHLLKVARTWDKQQRHHQLIALAESLGDRLKLVGGLTDLLVEHSRATAWGWSAVTIQRLLWRFDRPRHEATLPDAMRRWFDSGWFAEILSLAGHQEVPGKRQPPLHPEIARALEKIARGAGRNEHVVQAVTMLRVRAVAHFDRILPDLLKSDPSYVCLPVVYWHLHARRQDLLGGFLGEKVIKGRFAPTGSRWILPYKSGFHRWTPAQNRTFSAALSAIVDDHDRDTPTIWRCLAVLAAMDSAPMDRLAAAARDDRPAIQDKAIRVMARCDQGQCVPTLIGCLDDERARIAIYGLRRALRDMLPRTSLHLLGEAPLRKVTVAKEVVRLLGELRHDAAYQRLVELDATDLHRDVRIALLRALWDHLDRAPTWTVFERAVSGPDWVMASRLGDIPADRLTRETDRLLSALLARVLARPEPGARIDLLYRAANLAISDPERTFLAACAARLSSIYDDEVGHAMRAMLHRATEVDMTRLPNLLTEALADPRCLHVAITTLLSVPIQQRAVWVGAARAAEQVLAADPRWLPLRIRCAAAAMPGHAFGEYLRRLGEDTPLGPDAVDVCHAAVTAVPLEQLADLIDRLSASTCPEVRRVAVGALVRDAGPGRGWAPERLQKLAELQQDPSPLVAGAALAVFPPREMAQPERHAKRADRPASKPS